MTFAEIYEKRAWGGKSASGRGSDLDQTKTIIKELPGLFKKYNIKSILDIPCGDFNWMQHVDLQGIDYIGADIVPEIIESNRQKYKQRFECLNLLEDDLPEVDLVLVRDCLGHLSYLDTFKALRNIRRSKSKYILTTTFTNQRKNHDIITGGWQPISLDQPPFFFIPPIETIKEDCTQSKGKYSDKSLGLWRVDNFSSLYDEPMKKVFRNKGDITIIFLTVNRVPEKWVPYHREMLEKAADGAPIITVSRLPVDLGTNILQTEPEDAAGIYWQIYKAAQLATTPYIAIAEDDTLYPLEHFHSFRPPLDTFAYNKVRWGIFTWSSNRPMYYWEDKFMSNMTMIAPRELAVEALGERFAKYPLGSEGKNAGGELGKDWQEKMMKVTPRKSMTFYTSDPVLFYQHTNSVDALNRIAKKAMPRIRSYDIPMWGKADEMITKFV